MSSLSSVLLQGWAIGSNRGSSVLQSQLAQLSAAPQQPQGAALAAASRDMEPAATVLEQGPKQPFLDRVLPAEQPSAAADVARAAMHAGTAKRQGSLAPTLSYEQPLAPANERLQADSATSALARHELALMRRYVAGLRGLAAPQASPAAAAAAFVCHPGAGRGLAPGAAVPAVAPGERRAAQQPALEQQHKLNSGPQPPAVLDHLQPGAPQPAAAQRLSSAIDEPEEPRGPEAAAKQAAEHPPASSDESPVAPPQSAAAELVLAGAKPLAGATGGGAGARHAASEGSLKQAASEGSLKQAAACHAAPLAVAVGVDAALPVNPTDAPDTPATIGPPPVQGNPDGTDAPDTPPRLLASDSEGARDTEEPQWVRKNCS